MIAPPPAGTVNSVFGAYVAWNQIGEPQSLVLEPVGWLTLPSTTVASAAAGTITANDSPSTRSAIRRLRRVAATQIMGGSVFANSDSAQREKPATCGGKPTRGELTAALATRAAAPRAV